MMSHTTTPRRTFAARLLSLIVAVASVTALLAAAGGAITTASAASFASITGDTTTTSTQAQQVPTALPDTGQGTCYDNNQPVECPQEGAAFYGQDAQYASAQPSYTDNGDGTVTDNVTGLMWQQSPDTNGDGAITANDKLTYDAASARAGAITLAGYDDWRLPTIKELYSLILFDGTDVSICMEQGTCTGVPFIDTRYFDFAYGDTDAGERIIDAQFASSTLYIGTTQGSTLMFGVNFADGRIKGYGTGPMPGQSEGKGFFVLYVRGGTGYGTNAFADNGNGTITDQATGLTWMQDDSGAGMNWEDALDTCETLSYAGYDDWRLPNAKELQSIVDYTRAPDATGSAAIDPLFNVTAITNESGAVDYPFYWTSTTHASANGYGSTAVYVAFGRSLGYMNDRWIDVHGAGSQRSDPKAGDASQYPTGHGPQGDAIRIDNYVRCVRGGAVTLEANGVTATDRPGTSPVSSASSSTPGAAGQPEPNQINDQNQPPQTGQQPGQQPPNGQPPVEAINACSSAAQGAACQFSAPQGTITGTCQPVANGELACVPVGGPAGGPAGGPPNGAPDA